MGIQKLYLLSSPVHHYRSLPNYENLYASENPGNGEKGPNKTTEFHPWKFTKQQYVTVIRGRVSYFD